MVNYRLLGSATTNSQGVATYTYTGVGAGELDIIASTDSTIRSSSLLSETYSLLDCTFYDEGTETSYGIWNEWSVYAPTITRNSEYTSVTIGENYTDARMYQTIDPTNTICIEFDIKHDTSANTNYFATIRNGTSVLGNIYLNRLGLSTGEWHHIKIEVSSTGFTMSSDSTSATYTAIASDINRFYFQVTNGTLNYKNFMIYPI